MVLELELGRVLGSVLGGVLRGELGSVIVHLVWCVPLQHGYL